MQFKCRRPEYSDHQVAIEADSASDAAEYAAAHWCHRDAEYTETYVEVEDPSGAVSAFNVSVEACPVFFASSTELKQDGPPDATQD